MSEDADAKLVTMANQIAIHLRRERGSPAVAVAQHMRAFWPPAMRARIVALAALGDCGLTPLAAAAVAQLSDRAADAGR